MNRIMLSSYYIVCCCIAALQSNAQDVGFSQFYDQPLLRNPALAGIFEGDVRFSASYRNQWQSITVPYRTFSLSSELKVPANILSDDNLTFGLQMIRDVAGTSEFSTLQLLPAINYSLPLSAGSNSYLSAAFMGGWRQQKFDPSKLILNDQFVAGSNGSFTILPASRQVFDNTSVNYFDLSAGLSYNGAIGENTDYFIGAALFHINNPEVGFFDGQQIVLNKKLALNAGISAPLSEFDQVVLYADYFKQFDDSYAPVGISTFQAGVLFRHDLLVLDHIENALSAGVLYRINDAVIPVVQLQLSKVTFGFSYDVNVDKLSVASQYRGGMELVITFRDFLDYYAAERRQSMCPRFRL